MLIGARYEFRTGSQEFEASMELAEAEQGVLPAHGSEPRLSLLTMHIADPWDMESDTNPAR